ncbi:MAG: class I SAM-dependent methyltransferase [Candidatus Taylorbacteria bacterium]|nr:class I SAM-dependent methyltransferase [Candidatus Taylorbacteria bacterium]
MDKRTIDTYDQLANEYDKETTDFWDRFPRTIFDRFIELTKGEVLDIGSGPGRDGLILQRSGLNVTCLDASEAMIKISTGRGLHSIIGDFNDLSFKDGSFDGVWAYTSLLHVPKSEIDQSISEIHRVLKSNGIFGLGMIDGENELYRESSGVGKPRWFSFYKRGEIERILAKHRFEIIYFEEFKVNTKNYLNFISRKSS